VLWGSAHRACPHISEQSDRLTGAFNRHAENIAEANSKSLVSALSEVVRDFNARINEQFGDNFRQLNSAVERLVSWQVQYEQQLKALIEQETASSRSGRTRKRELRRFSR
jgi:cell division septum initiation protein DivIVA